MWQNKQFRTLCWQIVNAIIAFVISYCSGLEGQLQVVAVGLIIPVLNLITKYINTTYLSDLGVKKDEN